MRDTFVGQNGRIGVWKKFPSDMLHIDAPAGFDALRVQINGTTRLRVHDNAGISLGANVIPPAAGLYVLGESRFDGIPKPDNDVLYALGTSTHRWHTVFSANVVNQTSAIRLKRDIKPTKYGLSEVLKMEPIQYKWKDDPGDSNRIGLSAENILKIIPEVVNQDQTNPNVPLSINYAELIPVLVNAIRDQQILIEKLNMQMKKVQQQ